METEVPFVKTQPVTTILAQNENVKSVSQSEKGNAKRTAKRPARDAALLPAESQKISPAPPRSVPASTRTYFQKVRERASNGPPGKIADYQRKISHSDIAIDNARPTASTEDKSSTLRYQVRAMTDRSTLQLPAQLVQPPQSKEMPIIGNSFNLKVTQQNNSVQKNLQSVQTFISQPIMQLSPQKNNTPLKVSQGSKTAPKISIGKINVEVIKPAPPQVSQKKTPKNRVNSLGNGFPVAPKTQFGLRQL